MRKARDPQAAHDGKRRRCQRRNDRQAGERLGRRSPALRWGVVRYLITMAIRGAWMHERPGGSRGARCNCLSRLRYVHGLLSSRARYPLALAKIGKIAGLAQVRGYYGSTMDRRANDHRGTPGRSPAQALPITGGRASDHRGKPYRSPGDVQEITERRASDHRRTHASWYRCSWQRAERDAATWCPRRCREPAASPRARAVPVAARPRTCGARWQVGA